MKILFVDDEQSMQRVASRVLEDAGYDCVCIGDGVEAVLRYDEINPDLVILDVMMPRMDGYQVCDVLRSKGVAVPIIFLSAKSELEDKECGFDVGGDDYLTKPFSPRELIMHVNARLRQDRRKSPNVGQDVVVGDFSIDVAKRTVEKAGKAIALTPREFSIFLLLAMHPGEVFTREQLIREIWGDNCFGDPSAAAVFVRRIREKIEDDPSDPKYLQTVWKVGYRFLA